MPGFLLEDDAVEARKNIFDNWLDEQKKKAEGAARAAQETAANAVGAVQGGVQQLSAEAQQRKQEFDNWLASQQQTPATPSLSQPASQPTPAPMPTPVPVAPSAPTTPEAQQRSNAFDDWLTQRQQDVQNVTQAIQGAADQVLPHSEEPATVTDAVPTGPDIGSRWKTQFDFGATYTGNYRTGTPHRGVDLVPSSGSGIGTEVDAFAPGTVSNIFRDPGGAGGLIVYVQDDRGLTHAYMHLNSVAAGLQVGSHVDRGTPIATMGESGTEGSPHLHYEVRKNAASGDPLDQLIDPRPYITGGQQRAPGPVQTAIDTVQGVSDRVRGQIDNIRRAADETGVPQAIIAAIMDTEGGGPNSVSPAGAKGFMQLMDATAQRFGVRDPFDPLQNILGGARYLKELFDQTGAWDKAAAAYFGAFDWASNQITGARDAGGQSGPGYVSRFQSFLDQYGGTPAAAASTAQRTRPSILDTLGQGAQSVAQRAADLERSSGELVRSTGQGMQDAMSQLEATRARIAAENERYDQEQRDRRNAQLADIMQTRRFELPDTGFQAPDLSGIRNALEPLNQPPLAEGSPLRQQLDELLRPKYAQSIEQGRQRLEQGYGAPAGLMSGEQLAVLGAARADEQIGNDNAERIIQKAKDAGWTPDPQGEDVAKIVLSQLTPINIAGGLIGGPETLTLRGLAEGAMFLGLSALGMGAGAAAAPHLPEPLQPFAPLIGGFVAPAAVPALARAGVRAARAPGVQQFVRDERGELTIPFGRRPEPETVPETTRVYTGTAGDFARADLSRADPEALHGPGLYTTSDARVAGGRVTVPESGWRIYYPDRYGGPGMRGDRVFPTQQEARAWAQQDEQQLLQQYSGLRKSDLPKWLIERAETPGGGVQESGYAQSAAARAGAPSELAFQSWDRNIDRLTTEIDDLRARAEQSPQGLNTRIDPLGTTPERTIGERIESQQQVLDRLIDERQRGLSSRAGANVRAIDVPNDLRLLDLDAPPPAELSDRIRAALPKSAQEEWDIFNSPTAPAADGNTLRRRLVTAISDAPLAERAAEANRLLERLGYDGMTHQGGSIRPMVDENGDRIEHTVKILFQSGLDKSRNAYGGGPAFLPETGGVGPGLAGQLGRRAIGSVGGAAAGYATAPEGATEEERRQRAMVGAGVGLGLTTGLEGMGLVGRRLPRMGAIAEDAKLAVANAARAADEDLAVENPFSGPIADRLEHIGQQPVTQAEVADAARALAGLRAVGDRIAGVPQQFSTPEGLAQLRARLRVLAEEGATQKDWYSDSSKSIKQVTQGNLKDAERLAQLVAIYSPNTPVDTNLNNALQAWHQWKMGVDPKDFRVAMGAQDQRAIDLLYRGKPWEGRKTNNFYRNLMQHIDPAVYEQLGKETGQSGVTADIWMMRAFDYLAGPNSEGRRWLKAPSPPQYDFIQDEVTRLGKELGWTPEQTQAAIWSSTKAAAEGTGIVEAGFHYGTALERRMAQVSYTASPGSAEMQRIPGYMEAPEHERAAFNFASESGMLDPATGRDQLAEVAGVMRGRTIEAPEVYGEYVGPGLQAEVPVPAAKASYTERVLNPETGEQLRDEKGRLVSKSIPIREARGMVHAPARALLNAYAAMRGIILKQDAVPWTRVFVANSPLRDSNVVQLHIGRPLTSGEAQQLNQQLITALGGDGKHAVVTTADGTWILNLQGSVERDPNAAKRVSQVTRDVLGPDGKPLKVLDAEGNPTRRNQKETVQREEDIRGQWIPATDEAGKPLPYAKNEDFWQAVKEAASEVDFEQETDYHLTPWRGDGEYVFNDWSTDAEGQTYRSLIESAGRTAAFADVEAPITRRVRKAQADVAARYGWPRDPTNPFGRAAEPGAVGERGLPGPAGAEPAAGVGPRAPPETGGFTAPPTELPTTEGADIRSRLRDVLGGGQPARADPRFAAQILGAAGGVASQEATMSDEDRADPWKRFGRDIGAGVLGGLGTARAIGVGSAIARGGGTSYSDLRNLRQVPYGPPSPATPQTGAQMVSAFTKNNLLSGPKTHISNIMTQLVELARQPAASIAAGHEEDAVAGLKAGAQALPDALRNFATTMRTGQTQMSQGFGATSKYLPFLRLLGATDDFFRTIGWAMGAGQEGSRVLREAGAGVNASATLSQNAARISEAGEKLGRMSVFGEGTGPGHGLSELKNRLLSSSSKRQQALGLLLDAGVPFSAVPGRIWNIGARRIPGIGELDALARAGFAFKRGDTYAARQALGEGLVQSVISAAIIANIAGDNIRGPDDKEHPNGIRIGGQWYDYSTWGPWALPIALPAAWYEAATKEGNKPDPDQLKAIYNATGKALSNQFYAADLIKTLNQVGEGNAAGATQQLVGSYIDRYLPYGAMLQQANAAWDPILRDPTNKGLMGLVQREQARIPILAGKLPAELVMTSGEPQQRRSAGFGEVLGMQTRPISDVDSAINDLERKGYQIPNPTRVPTQVSVQGARIALNEDEARELAFQRGQAIDKILGPLVTSVIFQRMTDDQKARAIASRLNNVDNDTARNWERMTPAAERAARIREGRTVVGRREPAVVGR